MRQPFGGTGDDLVYNPGIAAGDSIKSVAGLPFHVYTDAAASSLANIQTINGDPISGSIVTVASTSQLPSFLGPDTSPDETYELWVRAVSGGIIFRIFRNGGIPGPKGDPVDAATINSLQSQIDTLTVQIADINATSASPTVINGLLSDVAALQTSLDDLVSGLVVTL
jgi:hypothetical protein